MESVVKRLNRHTIICGYGRLGQMLAQQLTALRFEFIVIEKEPGKVELARTQGFLVMEADATEEDVLSQAGLDRARAIVIALPTDAENVFITLTARNMQPKIKIIAQAEHESSCKKLRQAGVNDVVLAHRMVAQHMARLIARPSTANLFALLAESSDLNYELDELTIPQGCKLVGKSMAELRIRERYRLLIVGIKRPDDVLDFNPEPSRAFNAEETILLMGKAEDIDHFGKDNCLKA